MATTRYVCRADVCAAINRQRRRALTRPCEGKRLSTAVPREGAAENQRKAGPALEEDREVARILVAENDSCIRRVIALWLKRNGHEVSVTNTALKALALLNRARIDVIVTDVNLPGMNGLEFLEAVRAGAMNDRLAVILTSRCDRAELERTAATMGAVVHTKPFSPMHLTAAIDSAITADAGQGFALAVTASEAGGGELR